MSAARPVGATAAVIMTGTSPLHGDPAQDKGGRLLPGRQFDFDAGLCPAASCSWYPVGQQKVHEHEALRDGSGRRLYCRLTSFGRSLQIKFAHNS